MEAEFRKVCFNLYHEVQTANSTELPSITASLFHSPGGRKFLDFITAFVRFVVKEKLRSSADQDLWQPEVHSLNFGFGKKAIEGFIIENAELCKKEQTEFIKVAQHCQDLSTSLSTTFRDYKCRLNSGQLLVKQRLDECRNVVDESNDDDLILQVLRNQCQDIMTESLSLKQDYLRQETELKKYLNQCESIGGGSSNNASQPFILDVRKHGFDYDRFQ